MSRPPLACHLAPAHVGGARQNTSKWGTGVPVIESHAVVAVVDATDTEVLIWWTAIGQPVAGFGRLCGAWVLDRDDNRIGGLLAGRYLVPTQAGIGFVAGRGIVTGAPLDLQCTRHSVHADIARLQAIFERENDTRIASKKLKAPTWPVLPSDLDVEHPHTDQRASAAADTENRALDIAHWINALCACWDEVEDQRMARPWMSAIDGPERRLLPAVVR